MPSRPGEFHPEPLTDPDLRLSHHPARATARRLPPSIEYRVPPVAGGDDPPPSLHGHYTRFVTTKKQPLRGHSVAGQLAGQGRERHIVAKVSQAFDQAFGLLAFGPQMPCRPEPNVFM